MSGEADDLVRGCIGLISRGLGDGCLAADDLSCQVHGPDSSYPLGPLFLRE